MKKFVKKSAKKIAAVSLLALSAMLVVFVVARAASHSRRINLPTSKSMTLPVPGYLARTNSFPATIALSPDGRYAALLNQGYGTEDSGARQSIAILDLSNNQLRDFPDDRLRADYSTRQSYFIGLAFSSDAKHLYASIGSITDPPARSQRAPATASRYTNSQPDKSLLSASSRSRPNPSPKVRKSRSASVKLPRELRSLTPRDSRFCKAPRATACSSPIIFRTMPSSSTPATAKSCSRSI